MHLYTAQLADFFNLGCLAEEDQALVGHRPVSRAVHRVEAQALNGIGHPTGDHLVEPRLNAAKGDHQAARQHNRSAVLGPSLLIEVGVHLLDQTGRKPRLPAGVGLRERDPAERGFPCAEVAPAVLVQDNLVQEVLVPKRAVLRLVRQPRVKHHQVPRRSLEHTAVHTPGDAGLDHDAPDGAVLVGKTDKFGHVVLLPAAVDNRYRFGMTRIERTY